MAFQNISKILILLCAALLFTSLITGCGAKQYRRVEQSGFLKDYTKMQEGSTNEALYVYVNTQADCKKYKKAIIEPVMIWTSPENSALSSLDTKDQKMLTTMGWGTLYDAMRKGNLEITFKPGPDVIRVKAAITEATKANVMLANILAIAPYAMEATTLYGMAIGKWPFLGELAWEIEITDSLSGDRLLTMVDKVVGTVGSNMDPKAGWGDVKQGFDFWRENYGKRMQHCTQTGSFKMAEDDRSWVGRNVDYWMP